jgi:hypothetical protein
MTEKVTLLASPEITVRMGKFKASYTIVKESWRAFRADSEIALFPFLTAILGILGMAVFCAVFVTYIAGDNFFAGQNDPLSDTEIYVTGALGLVLYVYLSFVANFCEAGIYTIVHARFNGQNLSFADGIKGAWRSVSQIFLWSVIMVTVGAILNLIASRSKILGKIVASLLGAAWNILTYFALPSLVIDRTSVKEALHSSATTIRKMWGETIIINLGMGLFFGVLIILLLVVGFGAMILVPTMPVFIICAVGITIGLVVIAVVQIVLGSIFKLALYEYARTGVVPSGFTPALIQQAVTKIN